MLGPKLPLQPVSLAVWGQKYQLKQPDGTPVDEDVQDNIWRVAQSLARNEKDSEYWTKRFYEVMWMQGCVPAGRIMANAGAEEYKPGTSLINCTVSNSVNDSMEGILSGVYEAGLTLAAGSGIGYEFSTLRPNGSFVFGAGASTTGPLRFMDIYDAMCSTVASAGGRRGAQMATFSIKHPDIQEFIRAKRENGRLRQFNLSVLVTNDFMEAVENDDEWELTFPVHPSEYRDGQTYSWEHRPEADQTPCFKDDFGSVACKVYKTLSARDLWDEILISTYDYAEPGIIFIDRVNAENNMWWLEVIRATNPCGEQVLPPYGACLLGSIDLTRFVANPFTENAEFRMEDFGVAVRVFTRLLDNVVDDANLPLPQQTQEILNKRRHGMGFFGLGSALSMLGLKYGTPEAAALAHTITAKMAVEGYLEGIELAKEKGMAPVLDWDVDITPELEARYGYLFEGDPRKAFGNKDGKRKTIKGRELMVLSGYMDRLGDMYPEIIEGIREHGCRFTHHTSIAPTGTTALTFGNNASNGIEPTFCHSYTRNVIVPGRNTKQSMRVRSIELLVHEELHGDAPLPEFMVVADDLEIDHHITMQSTVQWWIDSSISKTINCPADMDFDAFRNVYRSAHDQHLKGCTTYRPNPEMVGEVLVRDDDLKGRLYRFTLDDGSVMEARGDETLVYNGEQVKTSVLFEALREGQYGRY